MTSSLESVVGELRGARRGAVRVVDAILDSRIDEDGATYTLLRLALAPPAKGAETWPLDDLYELQEEVLDRIRTAGAQDPRVAFVGGEHIGDEPERSPSEDLAAECEGDA